MKLILAILWSAKTTCDKAADRFQLMGKSVLHRIDAIDPHYADKRWAAKWRPRTPETKEPEDSFW